MKKLSKKKLKRYAKDILDSYKKVSKKKKDGNTYIFVCD